MKGDLISHIYLNVVSLWYSKVKYLRLFGLGSQTTHLAQENYKIIWDFGYNYNNPSWKILRCTVISNSVLFTSERN